ncbi:MAG: transcription elongation factor GreAB [Limisphaerales bacterium]
MNKQEVLNQIVAQLIDDAELYLRAARSAQSEATDEQSKAENKYDTRGLEAAYLARGQSRQAAETEEAVAQFRALTIRDFTSDEPIDLGAIVELKGPREKDYYFIGPSMGGTEVTHDGREITVITPASPLGQQLAGHKSGDKVKLPSGQERRIAAVL